MISGTFAATGAGNIRPQYRYLTTSRPPVRERGSTATVCGLHVAQSPSGHRVSIEADHVHIGAVGSSMVGEGMGLSAESGGPEGRHPGPARGDSSGARDRSAAVRPPAVAAGPFDFVPGNLGLGSDRERTGSRGRVASGHDLRADQRRDASRTRLSRGFCWCSTSGRPSDLRAPISGATPARAAPAPCCSMGNR